MYICFHTFSVNGTGPQIHPVKYDDDYHSGSQLVCNIVPVALNFLLIMSYARDLRRETKHARDSVELASEALNNFYLEAAQGLLRAVSEDEELPICKQLRPDRTRARCGGRGGREAAHPQPAGVPALPAQLPLPPERGERQRPHGRGHLEGDVG